MSDNLRNKLKIPYSRLDEINELFLDGEEKIINDFLDVVKRYGTPVEINEKANVSRKIPNLVKKIEKVAPEHLGDINWLIEQKESESFCSIKEYRQNVLGNKLSSTPVNEDLLSLLKLALCSIFHGSESSLNEQSKIEH